MSHTISMNTNSERKINPKLFLLWGAIISSTMIFAGLTSGYIVRQADPGWMYFELPSLFKASTAIILLSSVSLHWSFISAKKNNLVQVKLALGLTLVLGFAFLILQFYSFNALSNMGVFLDTNPSSSFLYVICFMHAIHIIAGLLGLFSTFIASIRYKVHSQNMLSLKLSSTFWHFLGLLWLYLFIFITING